MNLTIRILNRTRTGHHAEVSAVDQNDDPLIFPQGLNITSRPAVKRLVDDLASKSLLTTEQLEMRCMKAVTKALSRFKEQEIDHPAASLSKPDQLVKHFLAQQSIELFQDQHGEAFAAYQEPSGRVIEKVRARFTRRRLAHISNTEMMEACTDQSIKTALNALDAKAIEEGETHELNIRVAKYGNYFFHDLGNGKAVKISMSGYQVVEDPPIIFRHSERFAPLCEPLDYEKVDNADLWDLVGLLNLKDRHSQLLFICDLVAGLIPGIDKPISIFHGPQGSGKSKAMELKKRLLEPTPRNGELIHSGINEEDFAVISSQTMVLSFDNVTGLPVWLSNALCRFSTGGGHLKRARYYDDEVHSSTGHGIASINGINLVVNQPDLLDRSVIYGLTPIPEEEKRTEADIDDEFDRLKPQLLGAMYKILSESIWHHGKVDTSPIHRLYDWQKWVTAIGLALGEVKETIHDALRSNLAHQNSQAIDASVIAQPLIDFIQEKGPFEGKMTDLLEALNDYSEPEAGIGPGTDRWPGSASALGRQLNVIKPDLLKQGIQTESVSKEQKTFRIYVLSKEPETP